MPKRPKPARPPRPKRLTKAERSEIFDEIKADYEAQQAKEKSADWLTPFMDTLRNYATERGYEIPYDPKLRQGIGQYRGEGPAKVGGAGKTNSPYIAMAEAMSTDPRVTPEQRANAVKAMSALRNIDLYQKNLAIGKQEVTPVYNTQEITVPSGVPGKPTTVRVEQTGKTTTRAEYRQDDIHVTDRTGNAFFFKTPDGRLIPFKVNAEDINPTMEKLKAGGRVYQNVEKGYDPVVRAEDFNAAGKPLTGYGERSPVMSVYMRAKQRLGIPTGSTLVTEGQKGDSIRVTNIQSELRSPNITPERAADLKEELDNLLVQTKPRVRNEKVSTEDPRAISMDLADELKRAMGKIDRFGNAPMSKVSRDLPTEREYSERSERVDAEGLEAGTKPLKRYRRTPSMVQATDLPPGDAQVKDPDTGRYMFREKDSSELLTFEQYLAKKKASGEYQRSPELQQLAATLSNPTIRGTEADAREAALDLLPSKQPKERPTGRQPGQEEDEFRQGQIEAFNKDVQAEKSARDRQDYTGPRNELEKPSDRIVPGYFRLTKQVEGLRNKRLDQIKAEIIAERALEPIAKEGVDKFQRRRLERQREASLQVEAVERLNAEYQRMGIPRRRFEIAAENTGSQVRPIVDVGVGGKKALAVSGSAPERMEQTGQKDTVESIVGGTGRGLFGTPKQKAGRYVGKGRKRRFVEGGGFQGVSKSDLVRERQYLESTLGVVSTKGRGGTEYPVKEGSASLITGPYATGAGRAGMIEGEQMNYAKDLKREIKDAYKAFLHKRKKTMEKASDDLHIQAIEAGADKLGYDQERVRSIMSGESEAVSDALRAVAGRTKELKGMSAPRRAEPQEPMFATDGGESTLDEIRNIVARRSTRPNPLTVLANMPRRKARMKVSDAPQAGASTKDFDDVMDKLYALAYAPEMTARRLSARSYGGYEPA